MCYSIVEICNCIFIFIYSQNTLTKWPNVFNVIIMEVVRNESCSTIRKNSYPIIIDGAIKAWPNFFVSMKTTGYSPSGSTNVTGLLPQ